MAKPTYLLVYTADGKSWVIQAPPRLAALFGGPVFGGPEFARGCPVALFNRKGEKALFDWRISLRHVTAIQELED